MPVLLFPYFDLVLHLGSGTGYQCPSFPLFRPRRSPRPLFFRVPAKHFITITCGATPGDESNLAVTFTANRVFQVVVSCASPYHPPK